MKASRALVAGKGQQRPGRLAAIEHLPQGHAGVKPGCRAGVREALPVQLGIDLCPANEKGTLEAAPQSRELLAQSGDLGALREAGRHGHGGPPKAGAYGAFRAAARPALDPSLLMSTKAVD